MTKSTDANTSSNRPFKRFAASTGDLLLHPAGPITVKSAHSRTKGGGRIGDHACKRAQDQLAGGRYAQFAGKLIASKAANPRDRGGHRDRAVATHRHSRRKTKDEVGATV